MSPLFENRNPPIETGVQELHVCGNTGARKVGVDASIYALKGHVPSVLDLTEDDIRPKGTKTVRAMEPLVLQCRVEIWRPLKDPLLVPKLDPTMFYRVILRHRGLCYCRHCATRKLWS